LFFSTGRYPEKQAAESKKCEVKDLAPTSNSSVETKQTTHQKQTIKKKHVTCHFNPPKKNNTCPFYMFSDSCSQLMSTTSADFICLKTWAPNHTNVISKPWHFKVLLNVCVSFAVKVVATESYCISMSLMVTHIHSSAKNVED